jgi:hypothetical protein
MCTWLRRRRFAGSSALTTAFLNGMGAIGESHLMRDWTQGCIAVTNEEIEELWRVVPNGTRAEIKP